MTSRKNLFYIVIDALRWDVLHDYNSAKAIMPNVAELMALGFTRKVIANSQSTQFVMPSLFSLTYPLDHGGYNTGIRNRPKSYVEVVKEAGYSTNLISTCNQLGAHFGYDRGFDRLATTNTFATLIEQLINRILYYNVELVQKNQANKADTIEIVQREFGEVLERLQDQFLQWDKSFWPTKLLKWNEQIYKASFKERELLQKNPEIILKKLRDIAPGIYWRYLGKTHAPPVPFFFARIIEGCRWRSRRFLQHINWIPFLFLSHFQALLQDLTPKLKSFVRTTSQPWLIHMHIMDVHDCKSLNRIFWRLKILKYFPRIWRAHRKGLTKRRFLYDLTLAAVDHELGKIIKSMKENGSFDKTIFLITGDHGLQYAHSPRPKTGIAHRTHYEDIDVPLVIANSDKIAQKSDNNLDSMGVTATLLEAADLPLHSSFKGISAYSGGREIVISESAGNGNADLTHRDLYFTATSLTHKLMATLRGNKISTEEFYDLGSDPYELVNIANSSLNNPHLAHLMRHLIKERSELFHARQVIFEES